MKVVTTAQMRDLDRRTIAEFGVPGETLMDRAGMGVADAIQRLADLRGTPAGDVYVFAGHGNNGGDAFAAARYLWERGIRVELWLAGSASDLDGDALAHFGRLIKSCDILLHELPAEAEWGRGIAERIGDTSILVDGLLGTGARGPARGTPAAAIRALNAIAIRVPVVAIDVPSGLDADSGHAPGDAVQADLTVTMGLPKTGLIEPRAVNLVGSLEVVDIGIPPELTGALVSEKDLITAQDLRALLGRRPRDAHKGAFGHLLIVSGASGYAGAVILAARAALRSGTGLVTALVPQAIAPVVAAGAPEAMVHAALQTDAGSLAANCMEAWGRDFGDFDAVLIGPGMTQQDDTRRLVERILGAVRSRLVVDADALNVLAGRGEIVRGCACPVILTPHPGEMGRWLGRTTEEVQKERLSSVRAAVRDTGAVVVLKGAGTLVSAPGRPLSTNMTGNPGMAKGGMGDILAGLIGGLAAQGLEPLEAARLGVFVHGAAGDRCAWRASQAGFTAGDVVAELPASFRAVSAR